MTRQGVCWDFCHSSVWMNEFSMTATLGDFDKPGFLSFRIILAGFIVITLAPFVIILTLYTFSMYKATVLLEKC